MPFKPINEIIKHLQCRNLLNSSLLFELSGLHFIHTYSRIGVCRTIILTLPVLKMIISGKAIHNIIIINLMAVTANTSYGKPKKENFESNYTCGRGRYQITASHLYAT